MERLRCDISESLARVVLTRPDVHNAFDPVMIAELTTTFNQLNDDPSVRVIELTGEGASFCAGADLTWMSGLAAASHEENLADAGRLEKLFRAVGDCSKPLITVVNGPAIGGGCGLACCGDIVLAGDKAVFALSEVRLGILPAVIAPYVMRRLGFARSRRVMLTAERFKGSKAVDLGFADWVGDEDALTAERDRLMASLLKGGIQAQQATKQLLRDLLSEPDQDQVARITAQAIADRRVSDEGQEGMTAFFEKRAASWVPSR